MLNYLSEGETPSLEEVLNRKEDRQREISTYFDDENIKSVLSFKLNIAGEIKNNSYIYEIFLIGESQIINQMNKYISLRTINLATGPELFIASSEDSMILKERMISIEDTKLGRLFDIDIYDRYGQVSRKDLELPERKCFLCNNSAKSCSRSRRHSLTDILSWTDKLIGEYLIGEENEY